MKAEEVKRGAELKTSAKINININLPETTDKKVYQEIFNSLKDLLVP